MTPAPPRRPRQWWTVLLHSTICVGLAAFVAMPERHLRVTSGPGEHGGAASPGVYRATAAGALWFVQQGDLVYESPGAPVRLSAHPAQRLVKMRPNEPWGFIGRWRYRDAGPHVLVAGLFE